MMCYSSMCASISKVINIIKRNPGKMIFFYLLLYAYITIYFYTLWSNKNIYKNIYAVVEFLSIIQLPK